MLVGLALSSPQRTRAELARQRRAARVRLVSNEQTSAGATVREWMNSLAAQDPSKEELRRIARDRRLGWAKRTAAERMLRSLESGGDLADYADLLAGEKDLSCNSARAA